MNRLRQALGDTADDPRYIETLARRGYRWMVSVEWMEVGPTSDVTPRRWWPWAAALLVVIGLSGAVLRFAFLTRKTAEPALISTPLTARPGLELDPSFSPDGNQVAFSWYDEGEDKTHIYVNLSFAITGGVSKNPVRDFK